MATVKDTLQRYTEGSEVKATLGGRGDSKTSLAEKKIPRADLQKDLKQVRQHNEQYFRLCISMAVILFVALLVVAFWQLSNSSVVKGAIPVFGGSVAWLISRTYKMWREKNYSDCIMALVENVDDETLKTITSVLSKRL